MAAEFNLPSEVAGKASYQLSLALERGYGVAAAACLVANSMSDTPITFESLRGGDISDIILRHGDSEAHKKWAKHYKDNWSALADYE